MSNLEDKVLFFFLGGGGQLRAAGIVVSRFPPSFFVYPFLEKNRWICSFDSLIL